MLNRIGLNWIELKWSEVNCIALHWIDSLCNLTLEVSESSRGERVDFIWEIGRRITALKVLTSADLGFCFAGNNLTVKWPLGIIKMTQMASSSRGSTCSSLPARGIAFADLQFQFDRWQVASKQVNNGKHSVPYSIETREAKSFKSFPQSLGAQESINQNETRRVRRRESIGNKSARSIAQLR